LCFALPFHYFSVAEPEQRHTSRYHIAYRWLLLVIIITSISPSQSLLSQVSIIYYFNFCSAFVLILPSN